MSALLEFKGVGLTRGHRRILDDLSLRLGSADVMLIRGGNGSGKSSLIGAAIGTLGIHSGTIEVSGHLLQDGDGRRHLPTQPIGLVLQGETMLPVERPLERLKDAGRRSGVDLESDGLERMLRTWGLGHRAEDPVAHLSGGQRRSVDVLAGLIPGLCSTEPRLLVLDEPDRGLDSDSIERLVDLVRDLAGRGHGILVASHRHEWMSIATSVLDLEVNEWTQHEPLDRHDAQPLVMGAGASVTMAAVRWTARMEIRTGAWMTHGMFPALLFLLGALPFLTDADEDLIHAIRLTPALIIGLTGPPLLHALRTSEAASWWRATGGFTGLSVIPFMTVTVLTILATVTTTGVTGAPPLVASLCFVLAAHLMIAGLERELSRLRSPGTSILMLKAVLMVPWLTLASEPSMTVRGWMAIGITAILALATLLLTTRTVARTPS